MKGPPQNEERKRQRAQQVLGARAAARRAAAGLSDGDGAGRGGAEYGVDCAQFTRFFSVLLPAPGLPARPGAARASAAAALARVREAWPNAGGAGGAGGAAFWARWRTLREVDAFRRARLPLLGAAVLEGATRRAVMYPGQTEQAQPPKIRVMQTS